MFGVMTPTFATPAAAQDARPCPSYGQTIADGGYATFSCSVGSTDVDGTGGSGRTCEYTNLIKQDTNYSLAVYNTGGRDYDTGPPAAQGEIVISDVTVVTTSADGGSSVEFENVTVTGQDRHFSEDGSWWRANCQDADGGNYTVQTVPGGRTTTVRRVIESALATLNVDPTPGFSHSGDDASALQLATFFWLETVDFNTQRFSSSASFGNFQVTVTADPSSYRFGIDGDRVECGDRNARYVRGMDEGDSLACTHTFTEMPTDGGDIKVDLTVVYGMSYQTNAQGLVGPVPMADLDVTTPALDHRLIEVVGLTVNG